MLHAAATLIVLWLLWLALVAGWSGGDAAVAGFFAALACVALAARLFGPSKIYLRTLQFAALAASRTPARLRGALATVRAAIAADVALRPALVRVKVGARSDAARSAFAALLSSAPGSTVVTADEGGLLIHVLDEDAVDARELGDLEARASEALGEVR
jgi:multisubunit Na+/H+ antiporter MnhE subunit